MKHLNQFITEYIVKKKLDKPIDSEDHYKYFPKTKQELIDNINELISKDIYDFNCIDTSAITDMSHLFEMSLNKYDISVIALVLIQLKLYIPLFTSSSMFSFNSSFVSG